MNEVLLAVACMVCVSVLYFMNKTRQSKCDESYNYRPSIGKNTLKSSRRFKRRR